MGRADRDLFGIIGSDMPPKFRCVSDRVPRSAHDVEALIIGLLLKLDREGHPAEAFTRPIKPWVNMCRRSNDDVDGETSCATNQGVLALFLHVLEDVVRHFMR